MEAISAKWQPVQAYLLQEDHAVGRFMKIFGDARLPKDSVLLAMLGVIGLLLVTASHREQRVMSAFMTVPFPLQRSADALIPVEDKSDEMSKWLVYWLVYAMFEFVEPYCLHVLFYSLSKTAFLICLFLPPIDLLTPLFVEWMKPFLFAWNGVPNRETLKKAHVLLLKEMGLTVDQLSTVGDEELKLKMSNVRPSDLIRNLYVAYVPTNLDNSLLTPPKSGLIAPPPSLATTQSSEPPSSEAAPSQEGVPGQQNQIGQK